MELLERESLLASLHGFHADAAGGAGALVFLAGEAGIGKSAVVGAFLAGLPATTVVHRGFCDTLGTPRALGPLHDIARARPDGLARVLAAGGDRHALFTAFLDTIGTGPTVTVIEDAHWADAATVDLLLFVGRRIGDLRALVVVTHRAEEVTGEHPLRRVLGDLATVRSVRRLIVAPLTEAAVRVLAEPEGRDGARLHAVTGGNPFFVTEALAVPADQVPATVRDAVLARAGRLGVAARAVLDVVALVPDRAEVELVTAVVAAEIGGLDDAVRSGMLVLDGGAVRFRHELARRVIEADVPAVRGAALHRLVLRFLTAADAVDPARLSFHADAAGDSAAVLRHASAAARLAAGLGAHREAAAHYERAVRHAGGAPPDIRAQLWERRADACNRSGELADALDASACSAELWRAAGDVEGEAAVLARRSHLLWNAARTVDARETARAAVALLEPRPPGPVLAQAFAALARILMLARENAAAITAGTEAITLAERFGDTATMGRALNAVGSAYWLTEPDRAVELLTTSLDAARRAGDDLGVATALNNLGSGAGEIRRYDLAKRWLGEAVTWSTARDLDPSRGYGRAWQARCAFEQGRWSEATAAAADVVAEHPQNVPSQIVALTVLGRLRVRRGDPDAQEPLQRAWALAEQTGDVARLWPVAAGRAEAAWLAGAPERIEALVTDTYRLAIDREHPWATGELGWWLRTAGVDVERAGVAAQPWEWPVGGDAAAAARLWQELGCPYEAALAMAGGTDLDQLRVALDELRRLGAWPAAELVSRLLREHGVRGLPRRPREATLAHPAQLTERQVEVLELLSEGLRNADIAARLHLSPKTVGHHVSAILTKLGVSSRREAARWAPHDGE